MQNKKPIGNWSKPFDPLQSMNFPVLAFAIGCLAITARINGAGPDITAVDVSNDADFLHYICLVRMPIFPGIVRSFWYSLLSSFQRTRRCMAGS